MINETHIDWPQGASLHGWINPGPLLTILEILRGAIVSRLGDSKALRKLGRIIAIVSKESLLQHQYNLSLQIREFVLSCPKRIAFVRGVIGEQAIKLWRIRYANRFKPGRYKDLPASAKDRKTPAHYNWKFYALPDITTMFTSFKLGLPPLPPLPSLPPFPSLARPKRGFQPTVFWLHELRPDYQHVRRKPEPAIVEMNNKSDRLRADYYERVRAKNAGQEPEGNTGDDTAPPSTETTKPP